MRVNSSPDPWHRMSVILFFYAEPGFGPDSFSTQPVRFGATLNPSAIPAPQIRKTDQKADGECWCPDVTPTPAVPDFTNLLSLI